jgi:hypothetical protein
MNLYSVYFYSLPKVWKEEFILSWYRLIKAKKKLLDVSIRVP